MITPQSISEKLMYSTVRLEIGAITATGFFYKVNSSKKSIIVISNRHFAEQVDSLDKLNWNLTTIKQKTSFALHLDDGQNYNICDDIDWHLHPSEDLAFFDLTSILLKQLLPTNVRFSILHISSQEIPTQQQLDDLSAIENIVMVGYPNGLYDAKNNYPIFRTGKTASHPAVDYNGKKEALIDVSCIPGSSGSPVFILDEGWVKCKNGSLSQGDRVYFIGIENSMPTRFSNSLYEKTITSTGQAQLVKLTNYFIEDDIKLGYYIKSSALQGFNAQILALGL